MNTSLNKKNPFSAAFLKGSIGKVSGTSTDAPAMGKGQKRCCGGGGGALVGSALAGSSASVEFSHACRADGQHSLSLRERLSGPNLALKLQSVQKVLV